MSQVAEDSAIGHLLQPYDRDPTANRRDDSYEVMVHNYLASAHSADLSETAMQPCEDYFLVCFESPIFLIWISW